MAKQLVGNVSSNKGDKTIVVTVNTRKTHPLYKKQYVISKKFLAHDEKNEAEVGDRVIISESRPISSRKHHVLSSIVEKPKLTAEHLSVIKQEEVDIHVSKSKKVAVDEPEADEAKKIVAEEPTEQKPKKAEKTK